MKAVITAGGKGTRLSSIAIDIPKPMVKILDKPILQYQIENLKKLLELTNAIFIISVSYFSSLTVRDSIEFKYS